MTIEINSFQDFEDFYEENFMDATSAGVHVLYRGHGRNSYTNTPTISRYGLSPDQILLLDRTIQEKFRAAIDQNGFIGSIKLHPGFKTTGFLDSWLLLTQQRHLELPSRLLDWTMTRFVALYFAVNNPNYHNEAGHLWIFPSPTMMTSSKNPSFDATLRKKFLHLNAGDGDKAILDGIDPFNVEKTMLIHYAHSSPDWILQVAEKRRGAQGGKFIVSANDLINYSLDRQFVGQLMRRIEIPASAKAPILEELNKRNFHEHTVLPLIPDDTHKILENIKSEALEELKKASSGL